MDVIDYMDVQTRRKHLTIGDLLRLEVGTAAPVVTFDRNVLDMHPASEPSRSAKLFFYRPREHTILFRSPELGFLQWTDGKTKSVHALELEYKPNMWHPLHETGVIHMDEWERTIFGLTPNEVQALARKHWSQYTPQTRIGWRGPMILLSDLDDTSVQVPARFKSLGS